MQTQLNFQAAASADQPPDENILVQSIAEVVEKHPVDEKWLICPHLRAGQQWLDAVARGGTPVANTRPRTLRGVAMELAGPVLAREELELSSSLVEQMVLDSVWTRMHGKGESGYLSALEPSLELSEAMHRTLCDLRLAEASLDALESPELEVPEKGRELRTIEESYEKALTERGFVDYAEALRIAMDVLDDEGLPPEVYVLLPPVNEDEYMPLERRMLNAMPPERVRDLEVDRPGELSAEITERDLNLLRWVGNASEAPAAPGDESVDMFPAVGEVNEVREVLRRCLEYDVPLDEVEVLYTDGGTYVPLFYEELQTLMPGGVTFEDEPSGATFAEGIPIRYSRPGRLLSAWLDWCEEDFQQTILVRMIQDGLLNLPEEARGELTFAEVSDVFRSVPVHEGRKNYLPELETRIAELEHRMGESEVAEESGSDTGKLAAQLSSVQAVRNLVEALLDVSPALPVDDRSLLDSARTMLESVARPGGKLDDYALKFLHERLKEMAEILEEEKDASSVSMKEWLRKLTAESSVGGLGARPGCIHLAPLRSGGHTGRRWTFIVGMDDGRFPVAAGQDPILLDVERGRVSDELPTSDGRLKRSWRDLARTLAGLRGRVTLSYSCHDILEDREQFPSPALVSMYRILSGDERGDQSDFLTWDRLPDPVSFAASSARPALDEADWWLGRLCVTSSAVDRTEDVVPCFDHLQAGHRAREQRASDRFTAYDGRVDELAPASTEMGVVSSSRLQAVGKCPLAYFFDRVLDIELPEELKREPDQWLDPLEKGTLLHEVFRRFMVEILDEGKRPDFERDWPHLEQMLQESVNEWSERKPPPRRDLQEAQHRDMLDACRIFLASEETFCRRNRPVYLESNVGMSGGDDAYSLGVPDPVALTLPGGKTVLARGRLDRIDEVEDSGKYHYEVWDYKTGSASRYNKSTFRKGRLIQHALYMTLAEKCLRERVSAHAQVEKFGYFFASTKGEGQRITYTPEDLDGGMGIIAKLHRIAQRGAFLATPTKKDCRYCDFQGICRDLDEVTDHSEAKLENEDNTILEAMRALRG